MASPQAAGGPASSGLQDCDPSTWVDRHGDALYGYAFSRLRNQALAEDVVQETFLAALHAINTFRGEASERTWLVGILRHKVIDQLRKLRREGPREEIEPADDAVDELFDNSGSWKKRPGLWAADPASLLENAEFWGVFEDCLENLPERAAQAFSLRVIDGADSDEICKILNVTSNNLGVMLYRARIRLRECLEANWFASTSKEDR